ncbi:hypothetical protein PN499_12095 [Kamptonema animale CS-326]|uniref:NACHT domain-containing protein n=1 Tax=Kamptonema animale TaxID=92934 RepID=UPI002330E9A1|nr:hypothetical protein [Kamptonema animale]MDB9511928.1 hypothetical protein [Kamptonema animale CS-326]
MSVTGYLIFLRKAISQVALITFEGSDYFFKQDKLREIIANYLRTLTNANTEPIQLLLDSQVVLKSIEVQHGLLVERAQLIYSFSHLTFQEYFTAREIINSFNAHPKNLNRLVSHITQKSWREVFLLAVGMMQSADPLLLLMKQEIDNLVADKKLQQFLAWVNKKSLAVQDAEKLTMRAFHLAFVLALDHFRIQLLNDVLKNALISCSFLKDAINAVINPTNCSSDTIILNNTIDDNVLKDAYNEFCNLQHELALTFDHALNLTNNLNSELADSLKPKNFKPKLKLNYLLSPLKNTLANSNIDQQNFIEWWKNKGEYLADKLELVKIENQDLGRQSQFSDYQKNLLHQYYYGNKLLMDCLNSGCEVSPKVHDHIKHTLLLPISDENENKNSNI